MKIITGIASTTHIDRHNEQMAKSALDSIAKQIKEKFIPQQIEHDHSKCIGILLYGKVFQLQDGEYALGIVSGILENEEERVRFKTGKINNAWRDYKKYLDIENLMHIHEKNSMSRKKQNKVSISNKSSLNVADLLETHLNSTQVLPNGTVYKIKRFIAKTGDLKIEVYPNDHYPPHFHIISKQRGINARFDIETLKYINTKQGKITPKDTKKIQNFFKTDPKILDFLRSEHLRLS